MGDRYKIRDETGLYYVTFTVVGWIDLFVRNIYRDCLLDSLRYCKESKVHAYVIMTSHVHAILSAKEGKDLVGIIRDLKSIHRND